MNRKQRKKMLLIVRNIIMAVAAIISCSLFIVQARNSSMAAIRVPGGETDILSARPAAVADTPQRVKIAAYPKRQEAELEAGGGDADAMNEDDPAAGPHGGQPDQFLDPLHAEEENPSPMPQEGTMEDPGLPLDDQEIIDQQLLPGGQIPPAEEEGGIYFNPDRESVTTETAPVQNPGWQSRRELEQRH